MGIISNGNTVIDNGAIDSNEVNTTQLATDAVETAKIADSQITLAKLSATGTKDATTFLRGDNTFAAPGGGGKVLQVIGASDSTSRSTFSSSFVNSSSTLTATITPSSTSNKVLIMMSIGVYKKTGGVGYITIYRGGTNLAGNDGFIPNTGLNNQYSSSVVFLDSPNTTSATTYEFRQRTGSDQVSINQQGGKSAFVVMEIDGS